MTEGDFDPYRNVPTPMLVGTAYMMLLELAERTPYLTPDSHELLREAVERFTRAQRGWAPALGPAPPVLRLVPSNSEPAPR